MYLFILKECNVCVMLNITKYFLIWISGIWWMSPIAVSLVFDLASLEWRMLTSEHFLIDKPESISQTIHLIHLNITEGFFYYKFSFLSFCCGQINVSSSLLSSDVLLWMRSGSFHLWSKWWKSQALIQYFFQPISFSCFGESSLQ